MEFSLALPMEFIIALREHPDPGKMINFVGSKMKPDRYQNDTCIGSNLKLSLVSKRYPNNTNLKHYQSNNNKEGEDAVVAVDFKKLKEEGEERMRAPYSSKEHYTGQAPRSSKEHYTGQAIREQLMDLDFKESFIEKLLKDYPAKKIEEKLDLLLIKRNIQSPAGWLWTALKNDYQGAEQERYDEEPAEKSEDDKCRGTMHRALNESEQIDNKKILSREEALQQIQLAKDKLAAITPSYQIKRSW